MRGVRPETRGRSEGPSQRLAGAFALFVGIGGALVAGALYFLFVYAPAERAQVVEAWAARLDAMADDRRAAIGAWVASGISDATTVANFPTVVAVAAAHTGGREVEAVAVDAVSNLQGVIDGFVRAHGHRALFILDAAGSVIAHQPRGKEGAPPRGSARKRA